MQIQFIYELKPKTTEQDAKGLFLKTKAFILSKDFQDTAIKEILFKKYSRTDNIYPEMSISFNLDKKDPMLMNYSSIYYKPNSWDKDKKVDGYQTWYYQKEGAQISELVK